MMDDSPTAMTAATMPRTPNLEEGEEDEEDDNELGGPSPHCRKLIPKLRFARPKDFFDTQLTPTYMAWLVKATNSHAVADGAGVGTYAYFVPFDLPELNKLVGLLLANGLTPKPQFEYWFEGQEREPLFGNDKFTRAMDKHVGHRKSHRVSGKHRWKHFRRYFTLSDFHENPKESQRANPLWKVQTLIDELNEQASRMWVPGKFVAIDEQTIGFQGSSGLKVRITYKREGDGFQYDAVCDRGYTYSFWFRCAKPPNLPATFKRYDLSPTAKRVVWLALQLPNHWT